MNQSQRTLQEFRSTLPPAQVLEAAIQFFSRRNSLYAAFLEQQSASHVSFRGQGGEELIIAAVARDGATLVTGSTYIFDMQISRFFTTLPASETSETLLASPAAAAGALSSGAPA